MYAVHAYNNHFAVQCLRLYQVEVVQKKFTGRQRRGPKGQSPKGQARDGVLGEGVSSQKDPTPCCQVINRECQISRCPKEETKKRIHVAGIYKKTDFATRSLLKTYKFMNSHK